MEEPKYHLSGVMRGRDEVSGDFDGPLDLILLLLSKNKIEIQDVSISSILEQYLAYLDEMKRMDMEIASEFIDMASHLMLIKTKMLLSAAEQQEALSEMEQLIQSLQERQRQEAFEQIRSAAGFLEGRSELGLGTFTKGQEPYEKDRTYRYRHEPSDLLAALAAIEDRGQKRLPPPVSSFEGMERSKESVEGLKSAAGFIKRELFHRLKMRKAPELSFIADNSIERSAEISRKLHELL